VSDWWRRPGRAWCAVAALLAAGGALALALAPPHEALDWQPGLALREPWRAISAAFVHYSTLHVLGNAAGIAVVAAYGAAARVQARLALAWLAAWPLTQLGLLLQPALLHYGGASGVVHAGVAIATLHVLAVGPRWVGALVAAGLVAKIVLEAPWGAPLRHFEGFDIAIAPLAHASGALAGALCFVVAQGWRKRPQ
jgi:rhomboid family GlyGly-CTERM serine protease